MSQPWYFEEIRHDSTSAGLTQMDLTVAAGSLGEALRIIEEDIPVVVEDWTGQARSVFDSEMPGILEAGHLLLATLRGGIAAVAYYDQLAWNENTMRAHLREQWHEDHPEQD